MKRFFDYSPGVWAYFQHVDRRLSQDQTPQVVPAVSEWKKCDFGGIRAVLWDVYGTIFGVEVGDLERSCLVKEPIEAAAAATIHEFSLGESLGELYGNMPAAIALASGYLELIGESHRRSKGEGVEYPEVVIEEIWRMILLDCHKVGYRQVESEVVLDTAYRMAYFFDASLQRNFLYEGVEKVLSDLKEAGIKQGVISNAQFYTPIQMRRLLRKQLDREDLELDEFFDEPLMLFSYELGFSKPNPGAFIRAIDILGRQGIRAEEILYVGNDMLNDVWGAMQHGMKTVLFAVDRAQTVWRREDARCRDLSADGEVYRAEQIIELILGR
ncbi:MAG: HAD hydrolase-like protein [Planctomycetes bacterium]|nr:HAD hydrolase-like protein [Planctomycetota bacterium]